MSLVRIKKLQAFIEIVCQLYLTALIAYEMQASFRRFCKSVRDWFHDLGPRTHTKLSLKLEADILDALSSC